MNADHLIGRGVKKKLFTFSEYYNSIVLYKIRRVFQPLET